MIPKLHAKGTSFKGAAAYLLHDKDGAATSGRVSWIETVNLATANPQAAWRVMAATAIDAPRLKEQAGVKKSGRSSKDAVLHLTLSWSPDQEPTREEMSGFARRAINALKAGDRQAMIICHTDADHPHVHVLLNRVSPSDGRMLSSSKEKLALQALALAYEKESGEILCKQREANAEKRAEGEFVRGEKDIPRPEYEAMRDGQKEVEKEIPDHAAARNPQAAAQVRARMRTQLRQKLDAIKEQLRPQWRAMYGRQEKDAAKAEQAKGSLVERLASWVKGIGTGKRGSPTLPFQKISLTAALGDEKLRSQKQRGERAELAGTYKAEVGKMLGELKNAYRIAMRQLFVAHDKGGSAPQFNPVSAGVGPAPATPAQAAEQKRLTELAEKFKNQGGGSSKPKEPKAPASGRAKDRERDREPEL